MKSHLFLSLLLIVPLVARADPDEDVIQVMARQTKLDPAEIRQHYNSCDSGVTLTMKICGSYRWMVQDTRLNRVYRDTRATARERGYEASLLKSQKAWLAYRDALCSFEGEMGAGGGSAEGLYVLSCKEELTKLQADRLESAIRP
jgi:uncharacterized protein YecT (DUF1311 family)